ncbi:hypothetical protein [Candidatus Formimonas warabiya]|uniref:Uncharacterized protein n=1 Tax=Formimonas warabiya TaxID=1761012 RepID=A0A3G1KZK1_FORW1|nr:hypothetical protein [Candidatus Formimonas warabiya]ATW27952.1 hypothetical protein DCMF_27210 [Candidatus Formimonas warabiya]
MAYTKTTWVDNTTPLSAQNLNKIEQGIYLTNSIFDNTSGTDSYTITIPGIASYTELIGIPLNIKCTIANTTSATLNVNSLGAINIVRGTSTALLTGEIIANKIIVVVYDGANFQLLSQGVDVSQASKTETLTNKTLTAPKITSGSYLADPNGNELIKFPTTVASAVNEITVSNAAAGSSPSISASGGDTNIGINLVPKGTGKVLVNGTEVSVVGHAHQAAIIAIADAGGLITATDVEGAIQELFISASNGKSSIASAITGMGQSASGSDSFSTLASKISAISSDANAAAGNVLSGKTAYVGGSKITGTMPNRAGDNVNISSSVVGTTLKLRSPAGYYDGIDDTVYITDADFVASNIKNGINIFGLTGTLGASQSLVWSTSGTYSWTSPATPTTVYVNVISATGGSGGGGGSWGYNHDGKCNDNYYSGNSGNPGNAGGVTSFGGYLSISASAPGQGGTGGGSPGGIGGAGSPPGSNHNGRYGGAGGGNGGAGGTFANGSGGGGGGGGNFYPQQTVNNTFVIPPSTAITITVGAAGTGGAGGTKGSDSYGYGSNGSNGGSGLSGRVEISW